MEFYQKIRFKISTIPQIIEYVEHNQKVFSDDHIKLKHACQELFKFKQYWLEAFEKNGCESSFKNMLAPKLPEIIEGIEEISTKYNKPNIKIERVKSKIDSLIKLSEENEKAILEEADKAVTYLKKCAIDNHEPEILEVYINSFSNAIQILMHL